ncbi:MAG: IPT/TIG domain-containing protein [Holophagaceae bacterium]
MIAFLGCGGGGGGSTPPPSTTPTVSSVSPTHASPGALVTLTGINFTNVSAVSFNGHAAFSYSLASSTQINAVVPGNATTGPIQVTTLNGQASSPSFTVDAAQAPTIASYTPSTLSIGTVVTLTGSHFVGTTAVQFNGVNATTFTVDSDTQLRATAPAGLTAGTITVTSGGGVATSTAYTVNASAQAQVMMNTGFEAVAPSPIIWKGNTDIISTANGANMVPHSGTHYAWVGGYGSVNSDQITQDFWVPATATVADVTFYVKIITAEPGAVATDTFTVQALSTTNTVLGTLLTKSNLNAADYTAFTVSLLPHKGQVVRVSFKSQEDAQNATSFLLDDVTATIAVPDSADLKPVITSFTPTSGVAGVDTVTISGRNFFGLTSVTIGGASAAYTLTDGTSLSTVIPAGAANGAAPISIANAQGTGTSATNFTVAYGAPTITSVNPTQAPVGATVVIDGTYLGYAGTTLTLNGTPLTIASQSPTQLTFTVPVGATSGNLAVTTPGGQLTRTFTVNTAATTLDLHVDKVQLTQSTQNAANSVPIVAGKDGLIRVWVLANQTNTATPTVRITLRNNGVDVAGYPKDVTAPAASVPLTVNESVLTASWYLAVPGTDLTTPGPSGYSVLAVVNPTGAVAEADTTNNQMTATFTSTTVPTFKTTIFPVVLASGTGDISAANKDAWAARLAKMYPVASVDVAVGSTFTGSVSTLESSGTGWSTLLSDLATKHQADGANDRYYYGALNVSYPSGVAGLGYVPSAPSASFAYRTAIGWDKTSGYKDGGLFPEVFAHEVGHNMGRPHSPCPLVDGPANPDPAYPYAGGYIGVWGYDSTTNTLHSPTVDKDIMAYCTPNWVSDYVYKKILDFRGGTGGFLTVGAEDAPRPKALATARECLIVRGIVREDGQVEMLPSFRTKALPTQLPTSGEFTLECLDQKGTTLFSTALELMEVGCAPKGHDRHFVMALPLDATVLDSLTGLQVVKAGQTLASLRSLTAGARIVSAAPEAQRLSTGKLQLTWDATIHPAAMVRDADTGEVIAILSGGRQAITATGKRFDLVLSDGVTSRTHRLEPAN